MFKTFIDAIVAFFKTPQPTPVVADAPYKLETPAVTEVVLPVVETIEKPKKPAVKRVPSKKPVAMAAPLRKEGDPIKKPVAKKKPAK